MVTFLPRNMTSCSPVTYLTALCLTIDSDSCDFTTEVFVVGISKSFKEGSVLREQKTILAHMHTFQALCLGMFMNY